MPTTDGNSEGRTPGKGWITLKAHALLTAALVIYLLLTDSQMFRENEHWWLRGAVCLTYGTVRSLLGAAVVLLPLRILFFWRHWHRGFVTLSRVLALIVVVVALVQRGIAPPSPGSYFKETFGTTMPVGAHSVRVLGTTPADSHVLYYFSCSAAEISAFVASLGMDESMPPAELSPIYIPIPPLPGWPEFEAWKLPQLFQRRDGITGRMDFLLCDPSKTQVYVYKFPGADKTDAELGAE